MGTVVSVFDPELIKQAFTGDPDVWRAGEANARFLEAPAGASSVLVLDGEEHIRMRRMLLPPFHGEAVRGHGDLIASLTAAEVEGWPVGTPFAVHPRMQAITLEVILQAVIGVRDEQRLERLRTLLPRVAGANLFAFWAEGARPGLARSAFGSRLPWIAARREVSRLLDEEIAAHRAEPDGREDVLAMLIGAANDGEAPLSDDELRDQVMTLLVAGHETTAATLAWCFERLVHNPACLERLQEEIASGGGEAYLEAVVNETLRTRPVIDQALRSLTRSTDCGGYTLPAGTPVAASACSSPMSTSVLMSSFPSASSTAPRLPTPSSPSVVGFGAASVRASPWSRSRPSCAQPSNACSSRLPRRGPSGRCAGAGSPSRPIVAGASRSRPRITLDGSSLLCHE
jgi:cytochrome P450